MKYKLIKEYPGSPKLGFITIPKKDDAYYVNSNWIQPENYPEFWELVVEKEYEILSILIRRSDKHQQRPVTNNDSEDYITSLINCDGNSIHSVKRLSDGEIFTVGDKVVNGNIINEFELIDNKLKVWTVHPSYTIPIKPKDNGSITGCGNMSFNWLNNIKKFKQKLFTTEDGVDIFNLDKVFYINGWSDDDVLDVLATTASKFTQNKYFSTKEKAEKYIIMNKPVLSLKDVASIYISADKPITDTTSFSAQNRRIQDLVKSKIQQSV